MYQPFEPEAEDRPTLPMWGTIDRTPTTRKSAPATNYVAPPARRERFAAPTIDAPTVDVAGAWESRPTVQEVGTPVHRALATLLRAAPIVLLLIVLGIPATWLAVGAWDWTIGIAIMGGFGLIGIMGVTLLDLQWNSPSSTERHRIDRAYSLKRQELKQTHELRRTIVEAWLEHQERNE